MIKVIMIDREKVAIVIPVYNHGSRISDVVWKASALGFPVFVVDDGSTDNGGQVIDSLDGVSVLRHDENQGKGAALLTGFEAAAKSCEWALTMDADGQHKPEDCENLLQAVAEGQRPIVVGHRQGMEGKHIPWTSRFGRKFSNFWVRVSGGPLIADSQSGFRLYPLPESLGLDVRARRFQFEVEILVKACRAGIAVLEAPVEVIYQGEERISHFHPWKDFLRNSCTFSRLIVQRIFRLLQGK